MDKPATELLFIEEEELSKAAEALVDVALISQEVSIDIARKKVSRPFLPVRRCEVLRNMKPRSSNLETENFKKLEQSSFLVIDSVFYNQKLTSKLFRSGDIPKLANVVNLDKL